MGRKKHAPLLSNRNQEELVYFPSWMAGRIGYADRIRQIFQEYHQLKGLRMTQQRNLILDHLLEAHHHLGMDEIYQALKSKGIGKVTVFRALKMLEECKLIDKFSSADGHSRYEIKYERPHHDHLICVRCGAIKEIQWPQIERIQEKACKSLGFNAIYHRHEVFGICKSCDKKGQV
ncbi:MAG: Fur family transcriptional regulator [Elusimicrobiota bacterium]